MNKKQTGQYSSRWVIKVAVADDRETALLNIKKAWATSLNRERSISIILGITPEVDYDPSWPTTNKIMFALAMNAVPMSRMEIFDFLSVGDRSLKFDRFNHVFYYMIVQEALIQSNEKVNLAWTDHLYRKR